MHSGSYANPALGDALNAAIMSGWEGKFDGIVDVVTGFNPRWVNYSSGDMLHPAGPNNEGDYFLASRFLPATQPFVAQLSVGP